MSEPLASRIDPSAARDTPGNSHPVAAVFVFFASFLFAALPFVFDTDNLLVVAPCLIACFSCSILFLRLLVGDLGPLKYTFFIIAGHLGYVAGEQWYVVAILVGGTLLCSFLINRLLGEFAPVIRGVKW
jgi:hypothetical protein